MSKKLTQEEFLERLYEKNEYYRRGEFTLLGEYVSSRVDCIVIDTYGIKYSIPSRDLFNNIGPSIRNSLNKTDLIIKKFRDVHGDKYNYDKVDYKHNAKSVTIGCSIHGDFDMTPGNHLSGSGCRKCGTITTSIKKTITKEDFIDKCNAIHNYKYGYDEMNYVKGKDVITITCPVHGPFNIVACNHSSGSGCKKCQRMMGKEEFITRSTLKHGGKYTYDKFIYNGTSVKGIITCGLHGDFLQSPMHHLKGHGCMKCRCEKQSEDMKYGELNTISYSKWGIMGERSKYFDSYKVYIVTCKNDDEHFIKVGKTYNTVNSRLKYNLPYNFNIHNIITKEDPIEICKIEHELKVKLKDYRYKPLKIFNGQFECFSIDALHSGAIDELIKNYN